MHVKAVEAHLRTRGELPVNLRLLVEGEEEVGSVHFEALVDDLGDRLAADVAVVSDTGIFARGVPSLTVGLRGLAGVEVEVRGPSLDLHSGVFGGVVQNPVEALARMLASLKDPVTGRVTVPGLLRRRRRADRRRARGLPVAALRRGGIPRHRRGHLGDGGRGGLVGTSSGAGCAPRWRSTASGAATRAPAARPSSPPTPGPRSPAGSCPTRSPDVIADLVADALLAATPPGVTTEVTARGGGSPVITPADHPAVRAASRAMGAVFGLEPVIIREGGSIPPVEVFQRVLGLQSVLVGTGLPDDQIHAPNEKFDLDQYAMGIRVLARLWDEIAMEMG